MGVFPVFFSVVTLEGGMVSSPEVAFLSVVQAEEFGIFAADDPEVRSPEVGNPLKLDEDTLAETIEPLSLASVICFELDSTSVEVGCILLDCSASNDCLGVGRTVEKKIWNLQAVKLSIISNPQPA